MNKIKKFLACIIAMIMVLSTVVVYAEEIVVDGEKEQQRDTCMVKQKRGFAEHKEHYYYINKKIAEETRNKTSVVNKKIEKKLNENGIFDEEIKNSSKKELDELRVADMDTM